MNEEPEIKNAIIVSVELDISDRGLLDCWLQLDYGDSGCQGFGGYVLYVPPSFAHHKISGVAGHHIFRILEIAGIGKWSQLPGRCIRVEATWNKVTRIGHITKNDWYCPKEDFEKAYLPKP